MQHMTGTDGLAVAADGIAAWNADATTAAEGGGSGTLAGESAGL